MVISQGEIWWADLPVPVGSGPGFRRPLVVVQGDALVSRSPRLELCRQGLDEDIVVLRTMGG